MHIRHSVRPTRSRAGSRVLTAATAVAVALGASLAVGAGCATGRPLHYTSTGDRWNVPIEGFLPDGTPVVKVVVQKAGPFLFALKLDGLSTIDPTLAKKLQLWWDVNLDGRMMSNKTGRALQFQTTMFQVDSLQMGELKMYRRQIRGYRQTATFRGQPIRGVIGQDILGQSTVWHIDRDRNLFRVATQGNMPLSEDAVRLDIKQMFSALYTYVDVGHGQRAYMRILFTGPTTIKTAIAQRAGLARFSNGSALAQNLSIGQVPISQLVFDRFVDNYITQDVTEGELGAQFWTRYNMTINLHEKVIWLTPRHIKGGPSSI